jgi:antitoxin (DNA-binding transcriptional repressor) of toxin-antitoxin stability system
MKTVTTREFIHAPGLVRSLRPGRSLLVTDNGKPSFTVTKAGKRATRTLEDVEREAREISPRERAKVNLTEKIANLRK